MKKIGLLLLMALTISALKAQKTDGSVKGQLVDSSAKNPIADATVSVLNVKDSSLVTYTLTNKDGQFLVKGLDHITYRLVITHAAYDEMRRQLMITDEKKDLDLGVINPSKNYKTLGEVVVSSDAPIRVNGDTTEFKASAFKTLPNATVEDMLKRAPGMEVDKDGNVKSQGEQVQKILVDGKEFFGNDPKLATKNLTADMVESVQVFDDMSEQSKFTKVDDGNRVKTINIKLKKNQNKGYFGRSQVSYGDQGRYEGNVSFNKFKGEQRVSLVFNANNINKQGFSFNDVISSMGGFSGFGGASGMARMFGGGGGGNSTPGLTKTLSTGLNYTNLFGKLKMTGSYFYSNSDTRQQTDAFRRTNYDDSTVSRTSNSMSRNKNENHRVNMRLEYQIDSNNSILYTPSLTLQKSISTSNNSSSSVTSEDNLEYLALTSESRNTNSRDGWNWNNNFLFRHKFHKTGRTLTLGWNNTFGNSDATGFTYSDNRFFLPDSTLTRQILQDQRYIQNTSTNNNVISTSYTEPFGLNKVLELNYAYTNNLNTSDKETYNINGSSGKYEVPNLLLTNRFDNTFLAHRIGTTFRVQKKKYNYQFGVAVQQSELKSNSFRATTNKDSLISQSYVNFFPTANFNFTPARSKNLRFSYNGRTNQPSINQLQNVPDVTDTLNIKIGNPNLKQEFSHNINLNYNTFNILTFRFIAANLSFSTTQNKIVNSITVRGPQQITTYANVDGYFRASSFLTLGLPFKNPKLKGSSVNLTNNSSYTRDVSFVRGVLNYTKNLSVSQGAGVNINKTKVDFGVRANIAYTDLRYSQNPILNDGYFTQTYTGDFSYTFPKSIIFSTDFDYLVNTGRSDGYNISVPLWNASLRKQLFKKKNGEVRVSINDILNQNQSITRTANENYVQDTRNIVLKRYFMVSLLFNINKMGTRAAGQRGAMPMQGGPGMMRMDGGGGMPMMPGRF